MNRIYLPKKTLSRFWVEISVCVACCLISSGLLEAETPKPNVILFLTDDQGCQAKQASKPSAGTVKLDIPGSTAEIYKTASDYDLVLYLFYPEGHNPSRDKRPAAVFFFGGGWTSGTPTQFEQHARTCFHSQAFSAENEGGGRAL